MIASDAQGTAWVVFVLPDRNGTPIDFSRHRPSTDLSWVNERGGWSASGHEKGPQHKLPIAVVFPGR